MRGPTQRRTSTLLLVSLVVLSGCIATTPGPSDVSEANEGDPHATILSFDRLTSECLDTTGLGSNSSTYPSETGARIILNRTIKTKSPTATLNVSLSSNDSNPTTWTLHIRSRTNSTNATTCTGRVQFSAVIEIPTETYNITIRHNGNLSGYVFRTEHEGGAAGVAYGPTQSNNTTATTADSNLLRTAHAATEYYSIRILTRQAVKRNIVTEGERYS